MTTPHKAKKRTVKVARLGASTGNVKSIYALPKHPIGPAGSLGELTLTTRTVYGVLKAWPACDRAKLIARVAQSKTITKDMIASLRLLGFTIKFIARDHISDEQELGA